MGVKLERLEEMSRQKLLPVLDTVFSRWTRLKWTSTESGLVYCITCERAGDPKFCDAGHYIPRGNKMTRVHPDNVRPQCKPCNKWGTPASARWNDDEAPVRGASKWFRLALVREGVDVDALHELAKQPFSVGKSDLIDLILHYDEELQKLSKIHGVYWR